ncbi:MAG: KilA-N domain-containing protein [Bacteroidota bacterium]
MGEKINIEGQGISIKVVNDQDYISLTDIAKRRLEQAQKETIRNWINNNSTLIYLEAWEKINKPSFKGGQMPTFKNQANDGRIRVGVQGFITKTNAIGIVSKSGRYGGTYAHFDIAMNFTQWLEPVFWIYVNQEFKRLRSEEAQRKRLVWNAGRELARLNYPIQTAAIQEITQSLKENKRVGAYASEADMINFLVFGMTAKAWRIQT